MMVALTVVSGDHKHFVFHRLFLSLNFWIEIAMFSWLLSTKAGKWNVKLKLDAFGIVRIVRPLK
jgi:hypothetical protein